MHACRFLELALREGPDFGRGELSGVTLLDALEASWRRAHEKRGVTAIAGGIIYNAGIRENFTADWKLVVEEVDESA